MNTLTTREGELVSLGAALGSNCVPCIEYHVPEARRAGLTDEQIREAVQLADKVRQVPARKVLTVALGLLPNETAETATAQQTAGCAQSLPNAAASKPCCG
jgi:AhpD family alkylhydroperoxidase